MTTLTDRYVAAVVRGVPEKQRADLENELRASIADAVDDRTEAGNDPARAEHDAVAELGDPMVLAARYTERPLHLIGPALYPDWKRLVVVLEVIVVPIVLVVTPIVWLFRGESVGDAIGAGLWIAFQAAMGIAFWITVTFAIVERSPQMMRTKLVPWTPELLPDTATEQTRTGVLVMAGYAAVFVTVFIVSWFVSPFTDATGEPVTLLDPWIVQSGLAIVLVAVPVLQIGGGALQLTGRWNLPLAIVAIAVDVVGALAIAAIGVTGHALNPAFMAAARWPDLVPTIVNYSLIGLAALAVLVSLWENLRSVRRP